MFLWLAMTDERIEPVCGWVRFSYAGQLSTAFFVSLQDFSRNTSTSIAVAARDAVDTHLASRGGD